MAEELSYKKLMDDAFEEAVRKAVRATIMREYGGGLDSEIKDLLRDEAEKMIRNDTEIKKAIRDSMLSWISKQ